MDYLEVLHRAWNIVWKHKALWIFGILAGCARGGGGTGGSTSWRQERQLTPLTGSGIEHFFSGMGDWLGAHLWVVGLVALAILLLIVIAIFLGVIGRIGLFRGVSRADGGAERLGFGELFRGSLPFFWRVFGLHVLVALAFLAVFLVFFVPAMIPLGALTTLTLGLGLVCLVPLLCILIPVSIAVAIAVRLVLQMADAAIVIEDRGLFEGLRQGWDMLRKHVGPLLIVWLMTLVIGFVIGVLIALPILALVIPVVIAYAATGQGLSSTVLLVGGACLVVYLPILLVANGILTAYLESVWTLTYLRLTQLKNTLTGPPALPENA
jgi:hypothetical protein